MYARTKYINDECSLEANVTAKAQRDELLVCTSELKRKVRKDDFFYVRCMKYMN